MLQLHDFLAQQIRYPRRNRDYTVSQMLLALIYPIVLGLDLNETASFLRSNGTFQYLTGLPGFPDPQTLRRHLRKAPGHFGEQLHRANDPLLQKFIHWPERRSRLVFDLDSRVVTVFGKQHGAEVGYNPKYRGKRGYNPPLCLEAHSSFLWGAELRPGNAGTWEGSPALLEASFAIVPPEIRELRFRADAGFGYDPVLKPLEAHRADYAVVARMTAGLERLLPGLRYEPANVHWECAEGELRAHGWRQARPIVVARRLVEEDDPQPTLFAMGRYLFRVWVTNLGLTPAGVRHFCDGRAAMEPRIHELREDFALRKEFLQGGVIDLKGQLPSTRLVAQFVVNKLCQKRRRQPAVNLSIDPCCGEVAAGPRHLHRQPLQGSQRLTQRGRQAVQLLGGKGGRVLQHVPILFPKHQQILGHGVHSRLGAAASGQRFHRALAKLRWSLVPGQRRDPPRASFRVKFDGWQTYALFR